MTKDKEVLVVKRTKHGNDCDVFSSICFIYVAAMISIYLLVVPLNGYTAIGACKYRFFLSFNLIFIGVICLMWCELKLIVQSAISLRSGGGTWERICVCFFFLFSVVSGLLSRYPGTFLGNSRRDGILTIGIYAAVFLLLSRFWKPSKWILCIFAVSVSLFCVLGIIQFFGANPFGLYPDGYCFYDAGLYYAGEFWSTMGNTDLCAAFLALSIGIFASTMIRRLDPLYLLPLGLCVFCVWELNVQSGIVAMAVGLILLLPAVVNTKRTLCNALFTCGFILLITAFAFAIRFNRDGVILSFGTESAFAGLFALTLAAVGYIFGKTSAFDSFAPKTIRRNLLLVVAGFLIFGLAFIYVYGDFSLSFLREAHEVLHGNFDDDFGSGRIYIWKQTWAAVKERLLFGGGPDTLSFRRTGDFSRYSSELDLLIESEIDVAHNEYLNILVNQGLLSLSAYFGVLALSARRWWTSATKAPKAAIAGAGVLFYCIQAFFGISMYIHSIYFWIALAVLNIETIQTEGN